MDFRRATWFVTMLAVLCISRVAWGQIVTGSDGSDGVFSPTTDVVIDLNQAFPTAWTTPGNGNGVYDASQWAVVFKYESVNIPIGVTVRFVNRRNGNPPVIWLVRTNATIAGTVQLDGMDYGNAVSAPGGPGGFGGGVAELRFEEASAGFGPGGGRSSANGNGAGGSFGSRGGQVDDVPGPTYGNLQLLPLIGGSGGSGYSYRPDNPAFGGGGGGGAILIAANARITLDGTISADGGAGFVGGGGSGGGVRLLANQLFGSGTIHATGGPNAYGPGYARGGNGRVRIEANDLANAVLTIEPGASVGTPGTVFPPPTRPRIVINSIGGVPVQSDPRGNFTMTDVSVNTIAPSVIQCLAYDVPLDWNVEIRLTLKTGVDWVVNASFVSGNASASRWEATTPLPYGFSAVQARAYQP